MLSGYEPQCEPRGAIARLFSTLLDPLLPHAELGAALAVVAHRLPAALRDTLTRALANYATIVAGSAAIDFTDTGFVVLLTYIYYVRSFLLARCSRAHGRRHGARDGQRRCAASNGGRVIAMTLS